MSRVIKKVGDEVALLAKKGDGVTNTYGEEVFEAAFRFVGEIDKQEVNPNQPKPKPSHKPKRKK
ncbi:hypothetical protein LQK65_004386 [Vibrio parahaemolyticus]|nr:hypothetical protein [Vibrio parahaemolyticus]